METDNPGKAQEHHMVDGRSRLPAPGPADYPGRPSLPCHVEGIDSAPSPRAEADQGPTRKEEEERAQRVHSAYTARTQRAQRAPALIPQRKKKATILMGYNSRMGT